MRRPAAALTLTVAVHTLAAAPMAQARADQCATIPVTVRGEPSAFQWIARTKARASWRAKVRRLKGLGSPYSDWSRAQNRTEDCGPDGRGKACTFQGTPCRP